MKKIFSLLLALIVCAGTMFAASGTCGDNLTWDYTNGVLTISGTGAMTNWDWNKTAPWYSYLSSIKEVSIGNSVTSIGNYAFWDCTGLTSITIPNSVTSIGDEAFYNCGSLTSVTIPNSVTSIGGSVFYGCTGLPVIDNLRYADTYLVEAVDKTLSSYTIKEGTKWIGEFAFLDCSGLTSVTIPNSVTSIGDWAFCGCDALASITIPNSVTSIGEGAFCGCSGLTSLTIGSSVRDIEYKAFSGCTGLKRVTCEAVNPPSLPGPAVVSQIFPTGICNLYVPVNSVEAYKQSSWSGYFKDILPISYYYIAGTMNGWNVGANQMYADDNSFKASIALEANSEYLFKIVCVCGTDTAWYGAGMEATMHYGNSTDWSLYGDANVRLETTQKGNYEFFFVPNEAKKISVIIPEHTYSVVGPLCPDGWDQTSTKCNMTLVDGIYTFWMQNVRLEKNVKYEYKIVQNHSWVGSLPQEGNAEFYVEETNLYNLTFTLNPSTKEYGVTPVPVTVQLAGDLINEWSPEYMTPDKEYRTASITKNLKAGTIKFKVIITGGWLGDSQVFTRDNNTQTVTSNGQDMTLVADMDGDYLFIWTYATNSLQIIYPEELLIEGIEKVLSPGMVNKILRDGQLLILTGDKTYTITGQQLK